MSGRCLLDTNIIIALFADEVGVREKLANSSEVFLPSIAIGELYYGARKSGQPRENISRIDELAADSVILECNLETARCYGDIKNALRLKGRPLPENDIWIAAIAFQYDLVLITRDRHFNEIEGLLLEALVKLRRAAIMPRPEFVNPGNFAVQDVVFNDGAFAVAWGQDSTGQQRLAMRWNGDDDHLGYPTSFGRGPLWFFLPPELTLPVVRGLLGHRRSDGFAIAEIIKTVMAQAPAHESNL
jgi:tRNA(fMet)-specific endonuclease VapC